MAYKYTEYVQAMMRLDARFGCDCDNLFYFTANYIQLHLQQLRLFAAEWGAYGGKTRGMECTEKKWRWNVGFDEIKRKNI